MIATEDAWRVEVACHDKLIKGLQIESAKCSFLLLGTCMLFCLFTVPSPFRKGTFQRPLLITLPGVGLFLVKTHHMTEATVLTCVKSECMT